MDDVHLCQEARWLVGFWLNAGVVAPVPDAIGVDAGGEHAGVLLGAEGPRPVGAPAAVDPALAGGVRVLVGHRGAGGAADVVRRPAVPAGRRGGSYACRDVDYAALGAWCRSLPGQVVVCESEGATWLPFRPHIAAKATPGRGRTGVCREVLWEGGVAAGAAAP